MRSKEKQLWLSLLALLIGGLVLRPGAPEASDGQIQPTVTVPSQLGCLTLEGAPAPPELGTPAARVPCRGGGLVRYAAGWHLIAGNAGDDVFFADGPLYTLQSGDTTYEAVPAQSADGVTWTSLEAGVGFWVYFDRLASIYFVNLRLGSPSQPLSITLPAGQFVMIGNPYGNTAIVAGADVVYTYDLVEGYQETSTLRPNQGAFAFSAAGGTVSITGGP